MERRILVIDDETVVRRVIAQLLRNRGIEATVAVCGEEALTLLERRPLPDAVICDLVMPGINGVEVVRRIRDREDWSHLPILVLSGRGMHEDRDGALQAGANSYMTKPFSSVDLIDALDSLLETQESRKVG